MTQLLRALLEEMTQNVTAIKNHPARLEAIAVEIPHSIRVMPTPGDEPLGDFNCVMHALALVGRIKPPHSPVFGRFYADTGFLRFLIANKVLPPCAAENGALVVWSSADAIKHVGLVVGPGRATSKWGIGYVYEHALLEVPESYGDELLFYGAVNSAEALAQLHRYRA